ncbi:MAG TPA: pyrroline-5-carboxylate reductase [Amnibacterium sp.]|nr:pyrroline-5-carboxylate reductase [Amnibacterium sp.]
MTDSAAIPLPSPVAILGGGSMGGAVLTGLRAAGVPDLRVTTRTATRALEGAAGLQVLVADRDPDANRSAVRGARLVVVAVKPAGVPALLAEIADALDPGAVVVSVAAGVPIATMAAALPSGTSVLRAMPNTPSAVGAGVTGVAAAPGTAEADTAAVVAAFRTVGTVVQVTEDRIDALSAVSGSGPAYVYLVLERFIDAAVRLGFAPEEAAELVVGTAEGALRLLSATGEEPAELRRRVTSPKGTTERAVAVFEQHDLGAIFDEALAAAIARAKEIAAG